VAALSAGSRVSCNILVIRCALIFPSPVCMPSFYADEQRCGRLDGPSAEGRGKRPTLSNNCATCTSQLRYKETDKRNGDYANLLHKHFADKMATYELKRLHHCYSTSRQKL